MHYLTSNFNLMESNSSWNKLKKKKITIDENYNGLIISLKNKIFENNNFFHLVVYIDNFNFNEIFNQIRDLTKIAKKNKKNTFFYIYL